MGNSVLVFISHSSDDKENYIDPIVPDLEACYINAWIDKRKIVPGDNLRKSIFRDGLDKADVALIFFTNRSLKSSWVDQEIKHVLREELKKGNQFDLNKIIAVFDSKETYEEVAKRYPELTDDLLHLMPPEYGTVQLGQLVSAIWSKYLDLQGGDVEMQRQLLEKDKEIFQREKEIAQLKGALEEVRDASPARAQETEFERLLTSGRLEKFVKSKDDLLEGEWIQHSNSTNLAEAVAFGLAESSGDLMSLTEKGRDFLCWFILNKENGS
ncbi:MAG: toll/interleukin-1 receptor domain-containing protein [Verrucomicrobiota bacterium]